MRYLPGEVVISPDSDVPLLRTVHQAGHVTLHQLYASMHPHKEKRLWDSFSWRTNRLVRSGFLARTTVAGLRGAVLSLGENGELYLQGCEPVLVERAGRTRGANRRHQIWHDVELFDIQLALRRTGVVVRWESEPEIRAANDFTTDHYAKDYDAIVTFRSGHRSATLALEYERTPKSSKQYERVCAEIDLERKVGTVLYLVPNREMHTFLLHALRIVRTRTLVAMAREFAQCPQTTPLTDIRTRLRYRLDDCLTDTVG